MEKWLKTYARMFLMLENINGKVDSKFKWLKQGSMIFLLDRNKPSKLNSI